MEKKTEDKQAELKIESATPESETNQLACGNGSESTEAKKNSS